MISSTIFLAEIARSKPYFIEKLLPHLAPELFMSHDRAVFKILTEHLGTYGKPPSLLEATVTLDNARLSQEPFDETMTLLDDIYKVTSTQSNEWLKDEVEKFVRERRYQMHADKANTAIEAETVDGLLFDRCILIAQAKEPRVHLKSLPSFPTMAKRELSVLQGQSGTGKSPLLGHIGCDLLKQGFKVLYITLEITDEEVLLRCTANITGFEVDNLKDLTQEDFDRTMPPNWKDFRVKHFQAGSNANDFEQYIKDLIRIETFHPDVLIVDYLAECGPIKKQGANTSLYEKGGECAGDLKALAHKYNLEWPPKVRQVVKAQNPLNGRIEHGVVTPTVHERV